MSEQTKKEYELSDDMSITDNDIEAVAGGSIGDQGIPWQCYTCHSTFYGGIKCSSCPNCSSTRVNRMKAKAIIRIGG